VEETYEVLEALESGEAKKFADELGDLLLQIVFHAELARKSGRFAIGEVIEGIHGKMVRRHPHVFGEARAKDAKAVLRNWEEMKQEERQEGEKGRTRQASPLQEPASLLDGVARTLPAVLEAYQLTRRAARIGFDWEDAEGVLEKVKEEVEELKKEVGRRRENRNEKGEKRQAGGASPAPTGAVEEEAGDLLFAAVNVARVLGVDPEIALKKANRKFGERFRWMEREAEKRGRRLAETRREEMEELWNEAKAER
jgi:MazG family protein